MTGLAVAPGTSDILGHDTTCARLWVALGSNRLHHCYLFEGPRGVGKATVALRLAMAANCDGAGPGLPCAVCASCRRIASGQHPDVILVGPDPEKATEVISVEQVREIIRSLMLHRHSARRRFVIIDPMDVMRVEAVNALLKTLEEPPPDTGFILVTSRAGVLLPTVLSRSLRIRFHTVERSLLVPWLERRGVADAERAAGLAGGSPGVALELAEGRLQDLEDMRVRILEALGGGTLAILELAEKVATGDRSAWERRVGLLLDVLEVQLRDAVILAGGAAERPDLLLPHAEADSRRWGAALWPEGVRNVDAALKAARGRLHLNVSARTVVETLLSLVASELGPAVSSPGDRDSFVSAPPSPNR